MSYYLLNISTAKLYICKDEIWKRALHTAEEQGWDKEGTLYDFSFEVDDACDDIYNIMHPLYLILSIHMIDVNWDGNYLDRENQLVSDADAYYMMCALQGRTFEPAFLDFLKNGAFRICR